MTQQDVETELRKWRNLPYRQELVEKYPPATAAQVEEVSLKARKKLKMELRPEYLWTVAVINGSGMDAVLYGTHTTKEIMLGREQTALGIVEQTLHYQKQEMADKGEIIYGHVSDMLILPGKGDEWIGRHMVSREIFMRFPTYAELLKKTYGQ